VDVTEPLGAVRCAYCGHGNAVPPALVDAIRASRARQELADVKLAAARGMHSNVEAARTRVPMQYLFMTVFVVVMMGLSVARTGMTRSMVFAFLPTGFMLLGAFVSAALLMWTKQKRSRAASLRVVPSAGAQGVAACPGCGAPLNVHADDPVARCSHCSVTSLLPEWALSERARTRRAVLLSEHERAMASGASLQKNMVIVSVVSVGALFVGMLARMLLE